MIFTCAFNNHKKMDLDSALDLQLNLDNYLFDAQNVKTIKQLMDLYVGEDLERYILKNKITSLKDLIFILENSIKDLTKQIDEYWNS